MSATESESVDADTDDAQSETDEFTYYPQVTQHPTTVIEGEAVELVTGADIDADVEDTGSSFGVVFENPTVEGDGTIWQNRDIPDGFSSTAEFNDALKVAINGTDIDYIRGREVTEDVVEDARECIADVLDTDEDITDLDYDEHSVSGTDFKVADPTDRDADVQEVDGNVLGIDVGGGVFPGEEVEAFDSDCIMVWYGGISGQRVGRILDASGLAFARWNLADEEGEDDYLVKGLFQVPMGWRNTQSSSADEDEYGVTKTRDDLKTEETYPRVARPSVLREDIDGRIFIGIGRFKGGDGFEPTIGRAADDYEGFLDTLREDELPWKKEYEADILDMKYEQDVEERLAAEFDNPAEAYALYTGPGWQDTPEGASAFGSTDTSGGSFDVTVDVDEDEVSHPTDEEVEFGEEVSENIAGTGVSPDEEIFPVDDENVDLAGLVAANSEQFSVTPDVDAIRTVVYENTAHLDASDLEGEN